MYEGAGSARAMSRLDSFIRRLEAQRACIDAAVRLVAEIPGLVFELGLGNGRTYDHMRQALPDRRIVVFERDPQPHPGCVPATGDLIVGDLETVLSEVADRWAGRVALMHSDIGTGDSARNRRMAASLSLLLPQFLVPGGIIVSDQALASPMLGSLTAPPGVPPDRYFLYERR